MLTTPWSLQLMNWIFFGQKLCCTTAVYQLFFLICTKVISSSILLDNFSFDLRQGAKHWMDKDVLADRAYFHSKKTGSFTSDGVERLQSYLQINEVKISIGKCGNFFQDFF